MRQRARLRGRVVVQLFFQVDEAVDAGEPVDEGGAGLLVQQRSRLRRVVGLAQCDEFRDQRLRAGFDVLDGGERLLFFRQDVAARREQLVERRGRALVVVVQLLDQVGVTLRRRAGRGQNDVADGDRAVVHAAAEVDRIALLDAVDVVDPDEDVVDLADAVDGEAGQYRHEGEDAAETESQSFADRESSGCHCVLA